ncbi:uncharacterized protein TRAVEDRAFT_28477 [Trametes versicolor FP-101664 SS1]|uniref:uncharacterized protein n=1 Tax=Trametes versicolor (strain FP-101664) TaxID=717944 RepID=UPI0004623A09|nr:uncharacterized protein TRAVEDRAFT_28477 [Trametes versicolor FP-101664 SS1]EIW59159.1 hypothetical protein TRAVEDRAFT_28477 [Trametes versicolor FP-101664 SS1]
MSATFSSVLVTGTGSSFFAAPSASQSPGATGTSAATAFASSSPLPAAGDNFDPLGLPDFDTFLGLQATLNAALGLLLFGLLFSAIAFGAVCTKAMAYVCQGSGQDGIATRLIVVVLVLFNFVQMAFTTHAVYTSVVVDFGSLSDLLNNEWSIMIQIAVVTFIASIAQSFFVCRLHAAKHNIGFTVTATMFIVLQLALSIYSVVYMFQQNYVTVMLINTADVWPMTTTFSISGGLNIVLAALGYVWLQKPYARKFRGRTAFVDEAEYWTLKSLFACGILSLYNAVGVTIMGLNLSWLAVTFVLGNLYTLSVLLNVTERRPVAPIMLSVSPEPRSDVASSTGRASTATLAPDSSLWDDIVKAQTMYPVEPPVMTSVKDNEKERFALGYYPGGSAV